MSPKSALLLGSGFVATPCAQVLHDANIRVTIASRTLSNAQKLASNFKGVTAISLDVNDTAALEKEVSQHDVVISLIPYVHHVAVIHAALKAKIHVVTTSYISEAIQELDAAAKEAGITVMNEIGLDPGIDHLYAVDFIERVHAQGGKITSFKSFCCGLPAPEFSDNPLGYKFSWSPRGVLLALKNDAKYLEDGKEVHIRGDELMASAREYKSGYQGFHFVSYANRISTNYRERYHIPEAVGVIRGSLRYANFPIFVQHIVNLGFLSEQKQDFLTEPIAWKNATQKILGSSGASLDDLLWAVSSKTTFKNTDEKNQVVAGLKWLGIFSDAPIKPAGTPLDTFCALLEEKMSYKDGERDFVFLQHRFEVQNKDGSTNVVTSTLSEYGEPIGSGDGKFSAMERLVGIPAGVATLQVLNGTISDKGCLAPLNSRINGPLMRELREKYGIECREKVIE